MADKILVAYYSKTGHTKAAAQKIAKAAGGALHEIVPTKEYPASYVATVAVAKWEQLKNEKPALNDKVQGFEDYNVVLVGFPIWWFTCPQLIKPLWKAMILQAKLFIHSVRTAAAALKQHARYPFHLPRADVKECFDATKDLTDAKIKNWLGLD